MEMHRRIPASVLGLLSAPLAAEFSLSRDTVRMSAVSSTPWADSCRLHNLSADTLTLDTLYVDTLVRVADGGRTSPSARRASLRFDPLGRPARTLPGLSFHTLLEDTP